MKLKDSKN